MSRSGAVLRRFLRRVKTALAMPVMKCLLPPIRILRISYHIPTSRKGYKDGKHSAFSMLQQPKLDFDGKLINDHHHHHLHHHLDQSYLLQCTFGLRCNISGRHYKLPFHPLLTLLQNCKMTRFLVFKNVSIRLQKREIFLSCFWLNI